MKRAVGTLLLFIAMFSATDQLRAWLEALMYQVSVDRESTSWLVHPHNYLYAGIFIYSAPFAIAGAILAWRARTASLGCLLAALLGVGTAVLHVAYGGVQPFTLFTHAPWWLVPLFWGNLYLPAMASLLGALLWSYVSRRSSSATNAV